MSTTKVVPLNQGADLSVILNAASQNLSGQGYEVQAQMLSPMSATMLIKKDRDGFKNIVGLGLECRVTLTVMNASQLQINIDSEWTNKIIALAIGWFLCLIPFITGVVGVVNQISLPEKISTAVMTASASAGGYNQPPYQPPYNGDDQNM